MKLMQVEYTLRAILRTNVDPDMEEAIAEAKADAMQAFAEGLMEGARKDATLANEPVSFEVTEIKVIEL